MPNLQQQSTSLTPSGIPTASPPPPPPVTIPWYRRSGWVTAMVAGILLVGPLLGPPVLLIVLTGPVYARSKSGGPRRWDTSTKWLVAFFAVLVTALWLCQVFGRGVGSLLRMP